VLYFAEARELAGRGSDEVALEQLAKGGKAPVLADLLADIEARHPRLAAILSSSLIALNDEYCVDDHSAVVLRGSDEVAIITPVSGG
ncbi:Molybdopterin synthase catalytic subunit, partial [Coemansia nantahalensis]